MLARQFVTVAISDLEELGKIEIVFHLSPYILALLGLIFFLRGTYFTNEYSV